jgi:C-terminal processing protease CtpA/Prc
MLLSGWYTRENDQFNLGTWTNPNAYQGKIYILVNEETQSQAEYTCQYLSHAPTAKVIGSQTAGADGNVSFIDLPGIRTYFTSLGWYYGDWYQQQRNGVKIDSIVVPTAAGLRAGKDEVLEAALDCLPGNVEEPKVAVVELNVFPNPTSSVAAVVSEAMEHVTVTNTLGVRVLDLDLSTSREFDIDLSGLPSGVYLAKFTSTAGLTTSRLIIKE